MLWLVGLSLRPDYWCNLPNSFAILLNYTELALIAVGLTYVIAAGDIDLSVGAVLALAGSAAAYSLKVLGRRSADGDRDRPGRRRLRRLRQRRAHRLARSCPSFIATLGMFYIARGVASWLVSGQQLTGWTEGYNVIGRKVGDILAYFGIPHPGGIVGAVSEVRQRADAVDAARLGDRRHRARLHALSASSLYATGGNIRAAAYAGINTNRVRFTALVFCALCAAMAGLINIAYFRSFNPVAGQFRELDGIAAVIIGGGSIFGGYGTIIGSLAGAAVITLVRALLQLNVEGFTMPQHWINVFIGVILIVAVLIDIWVRQANILGTFRHFFLRPKPKPEAAHV